MFVCLEGGKTLFLFYSTTDDEDGKVSGISILSVREKEARAAFPCLFACSNGKSGLVPLLLLTKAPEHVCLLVYLISVDFGVFPWLCRKFSPETVRTKKTKPEIGLPSFGCAKLSP